MPEIIIKLGDNVVQKHFVYKESLTIGRAAENEIAIENLAVSRQHATISCKDDRYYIEDHQSSNGTFVNGLRIAHSELVDKDCVTIGKHKLYFYNNQPATHPVAFDRNMSEKTMLVNSDSIASLPPKLRVTKGKQAGEVFDLNKVETRIGRAPDNDIRMSDWFVSKHHALIVRRGAQYLVRDLGSWRHTLVNGAIVEEQELSQGDEIQLGPKTSLTFEYLGMPPNGSWNPKSNSREEAPIPMLQASPSRSGVEAMPQGVARANSSVEPAAPVGQDSFGEDLHEALASNGDFSESDHREPSNALEEDMEASAFIEPDAEPSAAPSLAIERAGAAIATQDDAQDESPATQLASRPGPADTGEAVIQSVSAAVGEAAQAQTDEIEMWMRALSNPSTVIRRQAKRRLKVLTGRDYDA